MENDWNLSTAQFRPTLENLHAQRAAKELFAMEHLEGPWYQNDVYTNYNSWARKRGFTPVSEYLWRLAMLDAGFIRVKQGYRVLWARPVIPAGQPARPGPG